MKTKINTCVRQTQTGYTTCDYNIYQGKNGAIYLLLGRQHTILTYKQVNELSIDVFNLVDFDYDNFNSYYTL